MVVAVEPLSDELIAAGQKLTAELDRIGLHPQGALWLHAHHLKDWRFTVVSDLVDVMGRRKVYSLIDQALAKIEPHDGLTIVDIHLAAPSEVLARVMGGVLNVDAGIVKLSECTVNSLPVDAIVYRLTNNAGRDGKRAAAEFERRVSKADFATA